MDITILPARPRRRMTLVVILVLSLIGSGAGVTASAARYDTRHASMFLEGVTVGGIDVGGMSLEAGRSLLGSKFETALDRPITLDAAGRTFRVTPRELGVTSDWSSRLEQAASIPKDFPLWKRVWLRLRDRSVERSYEVATSIDTARLEQYLASVAGAADRRAKDASVALVEDGLQITREVRGFNLDQQAAVEELRLAILEGRSRVVLPGERVEPAFLADSFQNMLLVKVGENKLYHYRNGQVIKVYEVATGLPNYPTPKGLFKIVRKRKSPTWYNPAKYPGGWGWNMPRSIPPGPRNPLGSRVLDMNGTLARIHATFREYSIGYNDSQGCVRMRTPEIEELFEQVEVGTPVLIVQSGSNRRVPRSSQPAPSSTPEPTAENDAGAPVGDPPSGAEDPPSGEEG